MTVNIKYYRPTPLPSDTNPFQVFLARELKKNGWELTRFKWWRIIPLIKNRGKVSIIHLHWPEAFWRSQKAIFQFMKIVQFILSVWLAKALGYKFAWSAHNVLPHNQVRNMSWEKNMRSFILRNFDLVIGHSKNCKEDLLSQFGTKGKKYVLAVHGHYEDYYPPADKDSLREELNISKKSKVIVLFGSEHTYKGTGHFLDTWLKLKEKDIVLIISGYIMPRVKEEIKNHSNIRVIEGFLPDQKLSNMISLADYIALPYLSITTSGMYFLALTYQTPVIASNLSFFRQHGDDKTMLLFDWEKPQKSLIEVLDSIKNEWKADQKLLEQLKAKYTWQVPGQNIAKAFEEVTNL